jgi:hypothetical protein
VLGRRIALLALAVLLALAAPAGSQAASWAATSTNWAGYAVSKPGTRFARVSATWVAPAVSCRSGGRRCFGPDVASVSARPVNLSPGGDAFTVTLERAGAPARAA